VDATGGGAAGLRKHSPRRFHETHPEGPALAIRPQREPRQGKPRYGKPRYKVDLTALHALCEANYARLVRLFPDYEVTNRREFQLGDERVLLEVLERSRYTTHVRLHSLAHVERWLAPLCIDVRAYHDAAMLEVISFQTSGSVRGRYSYPNPAMHQQDEKNQQNRFLADWLEHCLEHGLAPLPRGVAERSSEA